MKLKIIYTLLISFLWIGGMTAQLQCANTIEVTLNEDGEGEILASDMVENLDFYLANGTVTYFAPPYTSGVFESEEDIITIGCNTAWMNTFYVEYTVDGALIDNCFGTISVFDPLDACPEYSNYCEDQSLDCVHATGGYSLVPADFNPISAEQFAFCSELLSCPGAYKVAIGQISNAASLTYDTHIFADDVDDYITPIVLSYTENGTTEYDNSILYVWENLDCFLIPLVSKTVEMDLTEETILVPSMFLENENTCTELTLAITELNGDVPTLFFDKITLDCDDLGYHTIYLSDAETGQVSSCQLFLSDPLETCGPILGPGDKLIRMSNDPPVGTYAGTTITVNGTTLPSSAAGKGWIINEDDLVDGVNTLNFDSGPFSLNGNSTLDLVMLQRLIIFDEVGEPIQSIVMDLDNSGYIGIGDMIMSRYLILGVEAENEPPNILFKPKEFEFPSDFDPFDFDYDFTKYEFDKSDFDNLSFRFEAYKVGDFNASAATEDGLQYENSSTRDLEIFEVEDMDVEIGVPFNFTVTYNSNDEIKGLLTALVSNGIKFESMTANPEKDVLYNILNETEIRISFLATGADAPVEKVVFEISAISENAGKLVDLLGLKAGFPHEVINQDDEVVDIVDIEESEVTSTIEEGFSSRDVSIYPNPVTDRLNIGLPDETTSRIEVLDPMGKKILVRKTDENQVQLDISNLENGLYYISIENNRNIINKSFIKI